MSDEQVSSLYRSEQVKIAFTNCRKYDFFSQELRPGLWFHDLLDQFLILLAPHDGECVPLVRS
jgi:hypothetical protein